MATTKTTSASKSPFEIRLELLQMAQDHLRSSYETQVQFATSFLKNAQLAGIHTAEEYKKQYDALLPKSFTINDIIAKANELYGFVQKKD